MNRFNDMSYCLRVITVFAIMGLTGCTLAAFGIAMANCPIDLEGTNQFQWCCTNLISWGFLGFIGGAIIGTFLVTVLWVVNEVFGLFRRSPQPQPQEEE